MKNEDSAELRKRAESALKKRPPLPLKQPVPEDLHRLLHELQVHQVELEMQNEDLRSARVRSEELAARYTELYDFAPAGYFTMDRNGVLSQTNLAGAQLLGLERNQLVGMQFGACVFEADLPAFNAFLQQLFTAGSAPLCEVRLARSGQTSLTVQLQAGLSPGGAACRVVALDVTERAQNEAVHQARLRLMALSHEHSVDELLVATLDEAELLTGAQVGFYHFLEADQQTITLQAWSTRTTREMCRAEGQGRHYNLSEAGVWAERIRERKPVVQNDYAALPNRKGLPPGHAPVTRILAVPVFRKDLIVAMLGVGNKEAPFDQIDLTAVSRLADLAWDVVERKRLEAEKAAALEHQKQVQKFGSLERMAGAIAHNLNNALQVVQGSLELARVTVPPDSDGGVNLANALQGTRRVAEMSSLIMTYLGQTYGNPEVLDLAEACRSWLPMARSSIPREVKLEVDLAEPGPKVKIYKPQLQQVLFNLLANAWESLEGGPGVVGLTVTPATADDISGAFHHPLEGTPPEGSYASLEVRDNGCGIAKKDLDQLFDPFYSTKFVGRGLGLPVVLGILRSHGGFITVKSKPNHGSTFRIFLPIAKPS